VNSLARPFIKWAGGKSSLLSEIAKHLPDSFNRYFEPFLGGGAVFFYLKPDKALISDSNSDLINTYKIVKNNVNELIAYLNDYSNNESVFYTLRTMNPNLLDPIEAAARFIYLNKTCFNGLYRVNAKNEFNVPFGNYKNPKICDLKTLKLASQALQGIDLDSTYFENSLELCKEGDFVYLDPPYLPNTETTFVSYTKNGFFMPDHDRLASCLEDLDKRNVRWLLSNSDSDWVRDRYKVFNIHKVSSRKSICCKGDGRGLLKEVLIRNY
jgi:DNA adenine methylase